MEVGLQQFLDWGTATTISTTCGKVTGGSIDYDSALVHLEGIGAQDSIVGGPVVLGGNFTVALQSEAILAYALRSNYTAPSLTDLCFAGGEMLDGRKHTGAKINTLGLSCSIGEPLVADIAWLATADAAYTDAPKAYDTESTWQWFTGTASIGSASLQCQSFDIQVNNNCEPVYYLDTSTENQRRWPDAIKIGSQEVTLSVDVLTHQPSTIIADIIADSLASNVTASFTLTGGTSGTDTMTIALTNLARKTAPIPFVVGGGLVTYSMQFEAKKDASVLSITVA